IPDLSCLKNLETLVISKSTIDNYENLNKLIHIRFLELWIVDIESINFIDKFQNIKKLNLFATKVSSLNPLKNLITLEELRFNKKFDDNQARITDLNPIKGLKNLRILHIDKDVINVEPINNLFNLEEFSYRQITSFEQLRNLKKLKK